METCTKLSERVLSLEESKTAQDLVIKRLKLRVKKLEKKKKNARTPQPLPRGLFKVRVEEDLMTRFRLLLHRLVLKGSHIVKNINLKISWEFLVQLRLFSTAEESASTASASMPVSTVGMIQEVNIPSPVEVKDKCKGKMEEFEDEQTKRTKLQQEQDRLEWKNIRARVKANEELAQRLQAKERNKNSEVDQAKMLEDLINHRKRYFATQKAEAKRNKPMTQAQQRAYISTYIKNIGSYTLKQLKNLSFNEIKKLFETTMKIVNTFVPIETKVRGRASELGAGSSQATTTDSAKVGSSKRAVEA
nr:hypothetical protein [Tanacetum cinerariifolium]